MRSFYSPLSISAPFYGYLKLLSYTERKEVETRMRDPGIELRTSCTKAVHNEWLLHTIILLFFVFSIRNICREQKAKKKQKRCMKSVK